MKKLPSRKKLMEYLEYDPKTGIFVWKVKPSPQVKAWSVAGTTSKKGYICIRLNRKVYLAHRLAFAYMGRILTGQVDHINGDRKDNRWDNLREVDALGNSRNQGIGKSNKTGIIGVMWEKRYCKWQAQIRVNYRTLTLGYRDDFFEACCLRKSAELHYGFHKNHGARDSSMNNQKLREGARQ